MFTSDARKELLTNITVGLNKIAIVTQEPSLGFDMGYISLGSTAFPNEISLVWGTDNGVSRSTTNSAANGNPLTFSVIAGQTPKKVILYTASGTGNSVEAIATLPQPVDFSIGGGYFFPALTFTF